METTILLLGALTLGTWLLTRLLGPFSTAFARRLTQSRQASSGDLDPSEVRNEIEALHERVDFLERALANRADDEAKGNRLAPPTHERHDTHRVVTPV